MKTPIESLYAHLLALTTQVEELRRMRPDRMSCWHYTREDVWVSWFLWLNIHSSYPHCLSPQQQSKHSPPHHKTNVFTHICLW